MKKSSCIEIFTPQVDFYDRFKIAKDSGFNAVEFWTWQEKDISKIKNTCENLGLEISSISGDQDYSLCDPKHYEKYVEFAIKSFEVAKEIGAKCCVMHSNALGEGGVVLDHYNELSDATKFAQIFKGLQTLVPYAKKAGIIMVVEPLNTLVDHKGNFLKNTYDAADIVRIVDSPYCKVLYDIYHMHIMHGNIIETLRSCKDAIGHIHIADVPGRHEPGTGEINYRAVFKELENLKYDGYVAYELSPKGLYEDAVKAVMEF